MLNRFLLCVLVVLSSFLLLGCEATAWESGFEPEVGGIVVGQKGSPEQIGNVKIQRVPWERMETALRERADALAKSDLPRDQWTSREADPLKASILKQLQITSDPSTIDIIGLSRFTTVEFGKPDFQELAEFATKVGATKVSWASRPAGKADKVTRETVFIDHWESGAEYDPATGRYRRSIWPERATAIVPIVVQADATEFVAFWLR